MSSNESNTHEGWQAQADARCTPTARRMAAVELLIAQGFTWQGGAWVAPAKPEAVRLRDELRERAEFEAWAYRECLALHRYDSGKYSYERTDSAWIAWQAALAATGKQRVGEAVEDERFPGGFADAIAYVNKLEELAEGLHEQVIGCRSDGEDGASTLLQLVLSELKEKAAQIGEEVPVEEDVYRSIADMIEPYVQREGSNPDGPLPASVHDSVQIIFDHWLKTRAQVGEVQGDGLVQEALTYFERAGDAGDRKYVEAIRATLAGRQPVGQEPVDAIERIARLLYLRSCNRREDGTPMHEWGPMDEHLKDYYRKDARNYEALRNTALWPAGRENYTTTTSEQVIQ